jgi:hypothetical protein
VPPLYQKCAVRPKGHGSIRPWSPCVCPTTPPLASFIRVRRPLVPMSRVHTLTSKARVHLLVMLNFQFFCLFLQGLDFKVENPLTFFLFLMGHFEGFGVIGHAFEMCKSSHASIEIEMSAVPLLPGAAECIKAGVFSSLQPHNIRLRYAKKNVYISPFD